MKESYQKLLDHIYYEVFLGIIALFTSILAILSITHAESSWSKLVQIGDCIGSFVFAIDYFSRLYFAKNKWGFIFTHILEFLAIIPFSVFQAFRLLRLLSLLRALILIRFMVRNQEVFFITYRLLYVGTLTSIILLISSAAMYAFEFQVNARINNFGDALWWSYVTATTVGYGDIFPVTLAGRIIAALLMTIGMGLIGVFVGTITTFIVKRNIQQDNPGIQSILSRIRRLAELEEEDMMNLQQDIRFEWKKSQKPKATEDNKEWRATGDIYNKEKP